MRLDELLKKNQCKVSSKKVEIRKADISSEERPYNAKNFIQNGGQKDDSHTYQHLENADKNIVDEHTAIHSPNVSPEDNKYGLTTSVIDNTLQIIDVEKVVPETEINNYNALMVKPHLYLFGNEKKLYEYILSLANGSTSPTPLVNKNEILSSIKIPESCLKRTLDRLIKKGLVTIITSQKGRYGWRSFKVNTL